MNKRLIIVCLTLLLITGCQVQNDTSNTSDNTKGDVVNDTTNDETNEAIDELLNDVTVDVQMLKADFISLLADTETPLQITYMNNEPLNAKPYVSYRLIELMNRFSYQASLDPMSTYQITLDFDGYRPVYINLENENVWFEDADQSYDLIGIKALWDNIIIKQEDDTFVYDTFEKTILSQVESDSIQDKTTISSALLYYDIDLRLCIDGIDMPIRNNIDTSLYTSGSNYYRKGKSESAQLEYIQPLDAFMLVFEGQGMTDTYKYAQFYKALEGKISKYDYEMNCVIESVNLDEGTILLSFPPSELSYLLTLTKAEIETSKQIKMDLEIEPDNEENYNEMLFKSTMIAENDLAFYDYDSDGQKDLIVKAKLQTKFASSYINIDKDFIFVYGLDQGKISYKAVYPFDTLTEDNPLMTVFKEYQED